MYKITIKGEAFTDYHDPSELDGIDCQDDFTEYFDEGTFKSVKKGYMSFVFEYGKLWTVTEYFSSRELTEAELKDLADYTQGQWSDGIGEGFEQEPVLIKEDEHGDEEEVYISPWFMGQTLSITQVKE